MSSSPCHAIQTLWSTIEPFLDLTSTVAVSQTCQALNREIIDAETRRIKVSHIERYGRRPNLSHFVERYGIRPNLLPHALNNIDWPCLRRVDLRFGLDDTATCFPLFATQIGYANNLESLQLDVSEIVCYSRYEEEEDQSSIVCYEPLLELLGRNLARCAKFHDLGIIAHRDLCPSKMKRLMLVLASVLKKQRDSITQVKVDISQSECDERQDDEEEFRNALLPAAKDFFQSILSCPNMQVLEIKLPKATSSNSRSRTPLVLSDALMGAAEKTELTREVSFKRQKLQRPGGQCLHRLRLHLFDYGNLEEDSLVHARALLDNFSDCGQLQDLKLVLPGQVWAHADVVARMVQSTPKLLAIEFDFDDYSDDSGKVLEMLSACIANCNLLCHLQIQALCNVDGKGWLKLVQDAGNAGWDIDEGWGRSISSGSPSNCPNRVDIWSTSMSHEENFKTCEKVWYPFHDALGSE